MADYIERGALIDVINGCNYNYCDCGQWHTITQNAKNMIAKTIKNQPTADVVEVVRCKDCIFAEPVDGADGVYTCQTGLGVFANEFCSRGERREDD